MQNRLVLTVDLQVLRHRAIKTIKNGMTVPAGGRFRRLSDFAHQAGLGGPRAARQTAQRSQHRFGHIKGTRRHH